MSATMRDVARLAGVSVKTVSNVVNDFPHVSDATRERVRSAIDELGYQMNFAARSLSLGRTGMLTLAVPALTLPYFAELADAVIDAAGERGYTVLVEQTGALRDHEVQALTDERRRRSDGLILAPIALRPGDAPVLDVDFPLVLIGERELDSPVPRVAMANRDGMRAVTEHLLATGRRRVALLGGGDGSGPSAGSLRTQGYLDALDAAGVEHDPRLVIEVLAWSRATGASAMTELLDRDVPFDAVVGLNDVLALGAMRVLFERGLRVPDDVAVAGFDDIEEARYSRPSLTTLDPGRSDIATTAVDLLLRRIAARGGGRGGRVPPPEPVEDQAVRVVVEHGLIVRESTGAGPRPLGAPAGSAPA